MSSTSNHNGYTPGPWTKEGYWVVAKSYVPKNAIEKAYFEDEVEHYGGKLICESIMNPADRALIAAAPLLAAAIIECAKSRARWQHVATTRRFVLRPDLHLPPRHATVRDAAEHWRDELTPIEEQALIAAGLLNNLNEEE